MIHCVDLFCGLGGLTHGLARAGIPVVAGIDVDPECRFPYEQNNSARFVKRDVRVLTGDELRFYWPKRGRTLLAGCAPCQSFSTYSRSVRKRRSDEKWSLVAEFSRLVAESKPDFVTMENVPQLELHPVFDRLCNTLGEEGYAVRYRVIECAKLGVPQTRKRLVLLASRTTDVDLEVEGNSWPSTTVRDTIGHLNPLTAGETDPTDSLHTACRLSKLNLKRIRASRPGGTWRDWDRSLLADCHRKKTGDTYPSVYGRMEWDGPAPTITTQSFGYGNGRFGHPEQDRAITLREAALLQTFPESYQFVPEGRRPTFHVLGRLIGNAVPVRLGEFVASRILAGAGVKRATRQR